MNSDLSHIRDGMSVTVLYGGWSAEREVSLVSGAAIADALEKAGLVVTLLDASEDPAQLLKDLSNPKPPVVFNALHGRGGEDGTVQALLDLLGVPYTHSGVLASAVAMDKPMTKQLLANHGILSPKGLVMGAQDVLAGHPMKPPYIVKPASEGSSVGVHLIQQGANVPSLAETGWSYGDQVLVEEYIPGRELTVGVMGGRALTVTEIRHEHSLFDYTAKYTAGQAEHFLPADIEAAVAAQAMDAALKAHKALGCAGISRSDFRLNEDPTRGPTGLYFLEINTQPGFTPISLVPEQAQHLGIGFQDLCLWLLEDALCRA